MDYHGVYSRSGICAVYLCCVWYTSGMCVVYIGSVFVCFMGVGCVCLCGGVCVECVLHVVNGVWKISVWRVYDVYVVNGRGVCVVFVP